MKTIISSAFALGLLAASAMPAAALTIHIGGGYHHHRHCVRWVTVWHHHHRDTYCARWGW